MTAADTILAQLGGRRFIAMTGAKTFVGSDEMLQFAIPGGRKVRVTLDDSDTYTVELFRIRKGEANVIGSEGFVYADGLQESFTRLTGLYTSL